MAEAVLAPTPGMAMRVLRARAIGSHWAARRSVEAGEEGVEMGVGGIGAWGGASVGVGEAVLDHVASDEDQRLQSQAIAIARLPAREFGAAVLSVSGERPGVDGVGLAERSERADEGL